MRKKWLRKTISSLLAVTMVLGLASCGDVQEQQEATSQVDKASETSKEQEGTAGAEKESTTYPLDTDISLNIWCGNQMTVSDDYLSWKESPFHTGLAEKTGIEMNWIYPTKGADVEQAYNLVWLDTEVPEIVYHAVGPDTGQILINDNSIWDLTEYLPEYAPNYWEWINRPENEAEKRALMTTDGQFFCIPAMRESNYNLTWVGPIIRQDWLDECGLETPVTLEDWEKVLVTFKDKYNANLSFAMGYANLCGGIASGVGSLGFSNTLDFRVTDEGKIVIPQVMPEWVEMMEVLVDWWDKGLLDHDCLTADDDSIRTKALSGEIGISFVAMSGFTNIVNDATNEKNGANWVGLSYPRTEPGAPTSMITTSANKLSGFGALITKAATEEEMITALKWLDYGWTEEGVMYWNFGEEGESYFIDENGNPQWVDAIKNDPMGLDYAIQRYSGAAGSAPVIQLSDFVAAKNAPIVAEAVGVWSENTEAPKHYLPSLPMSEEDTNRWIELWMSVWTYLNEECTKMLVGERPLSESEDMIATANEMGLEEILSIFQKYYDEYAK